MAISKEEALKYHSKWKPGKLEVLSSKPCSIADELSLAYTPGVAEPCRVIHKNIDEVYNYTIKGNLVAVISDGTAVLGLGDIGPEAGKPVMEGKGVLFKRFADIDVFDIELGTKVPREVIKTVQYLEPTFGGINLEDIKAPECFEIEEELIRTMEIPVFHDDQHGTAIISSAAIMNAIEIVGKKMDQVKIVISGAGAAGTACAKMYLQLGVKRENIYMFDIGGLLHKQRGDIDKYREMFARDYEEYHTLAEALVGADVFVGVSAGNLVSQDMVRSMAPKPVVFAMANPDPEIKYEDAKAARKDVIVATGRSDYPNQVNNVLGFPFIFRGALDVRATKINEEMKMAASIALANLAKEKVIPFVIKAYGGKKFSFGPDYIIPKPFDPRVLYNVAPAVAKAAMDTGVALKPISDWDKYAKELRERLTFSREIAEAVVDKFSMRFDKKPFFKKAEKKKTIAKKVTPKSVNKNIKKKNTAKPKKVVKRKVARKVKSKK
ncbi:MAG: malate dehydrogenase [Ignavibacteriales bacterium]|nr:malate dehydrogenase [Ignavibacteriales bacterium]